MVSSTSNDRASRSWLRLTFFVLAMLSLAVTPLDSKFRLANKTCEVRPALTMLLPSLFNPKHILAFAVLAAIASLGMQRRPALRAWLLVMLLSAVIEIEQLFFVSGHCRVRDLLPNLVAATVGVGVAHAVRFVRRRGAAH